MRFADPWVLIALVTVPALALFLWRQRGSRPAVHVGTTAPLAASKTWRVRAEPALAALRLATVALVVVALARPQRGEATTDTRGEGIDIVLALDTSSSMSQPFSRARTRLQAAEEVLSQFVAARTNDRVGLVVFRGASITLSPLTTDYAAVGGDLKAAGALRLTDGTAIGVALGESANLLRGSTAASRIVILLTDGENNQHDIEPLEAARIAERLGVKVYTVGVVSPSRNPGRSTLEIDEASLKQIASITGGTYNRAEDPGALQQIYASIDALEKSKFEDRILRHYDDIAPYLLAAAAAALALEVGLRSTVFRRAA